MSARVAVVLACALVVAAAARAAIVASGPGSTSDRALRTSLAALATAAPAQTSAPPAPRVRGCGDPTASLSPRGALPAPGRMPAGSSMRTIQRRGRLIAGVDQNTLLFAYRNPFTGRIEGLEIDILRELARAIIGDRDAIELKAITTAQRIPFVEQRKVDVVADAVTINCARLEQVRFSTVYYLAGQRVLVPKSSRAAGLGDLGGKRVCATVGSTSIEAVRRAPSNPVPYPVSQRTDCLVALQQGKVDAISSDDAILLGFAAQDPFTKIVGPRISDEPYGIAIHRSRHDLVRFVNAVLERMRTNGRFAAIYRRWLGERGARRRPPTPRYRDRR